MFLNRIFSLPNESSAELHLFHLPPGFQSRSHCESANPFIRACRKPISLSLQRSVLAHFYPWTGFAVWVFIREKSDRKVDRQLQYTTLIILLTQITESVQEACFLKSILLSKFTLLLAFEVIFNHANLSSQQQYQLNVHHRDPSDCVVVSNSMPVSLLFPRSASFRGILCAGPTAREFREELYSTFISPWLFLASYIWAVDAARRDGLEDLGKDDAGEGRSDKQPYARPVPPVHLLIHFFSFRTSRIFPKRSLTATTLPVRPLALSSCAELEALDNCLS